MATDCFRPRPVRVVLVSEVVRITERDDRRLITIPKSISEHMHHSATRQLNRAHETWYLYAN